MPDFLEGITDNAPDSKDAIKGYATIVAGYLLFKGKKKKWTQQLNALKK